MPVLSRRSHGLVSGTNDGWGLYYKARDLKASGVPVTMLSIGDHDIKTSPSILDAMDASARGGHLGYTAVQGLAALRAAIAQRTTRRTATPAGPEDVIVASGGQGALFSAMMTVLDPGDDCLVLDPYYTSFAVTVRAASARAIMVPTLPDLGFQPDPDAIAAAVTPQTRALLINTPNNPSGAVYTRDRLEAIAEICKAHDIWLISDELYDCQVYDGTHLSPRDLPGMASRTIVIGSMSKGYAMTGARLGWAIAPEDVIAKMADLAGATTYGLPGFIQDAALFALGDPEHETEVAARYRRRRDAAAAALGNSTAARPVPAQGGMYLMVDVRATGLSGEEFGSRLLDAEKIAVMPGESFGTAAAGHLRIALTKDESVLADCMQRIARFAHQQMAPA